MANVKFFFGTQAKFDALAEKDPKALYFIEDTKRLYKGDVLQATGTNATDQFAGLMSPEDKVKLDVLSDKASISNLTPIDGTLVVADGEDGAKTIRVAISQEVGNALVAKDDGLFVEISGTAELPTYEIEKQAVAEDGYAVSYKLKKTIGEEVSYVGDVINIAKDMMLQSATLETVTEDNVPYEGAAVGDPYIDMAFNDASASHVYVPVKSLMDVYTPGAGIEIVDNKVSIKIDGANANGLVAVDGTGLGLALATATSAGAMSAEDKVVIDGIATTYATKEEIQALNESIAAVTDAMTWNEM